MDVLPEEVLALRKSAEHVVNFTGKDDSVTTSRLISKKRLSSTCMLQVIPLMKYGGPAVSEAEALCFAY